MKSTKYADRLGEIEDSLRLLEGERDRARAELAAAILAEGGDTAISSTGKTYKLSRPPTKYTFTVPPGELERLGILAECTPPPAPPGYLGGMHTATRTAQAHQKQAG